jgi:threonine synthase
MWRYFDRLPVESERNVVTLGEGGTPLIDVSGTIGADLGLGSLVLKAEDRNPTGSFKARIASVAASLVRERGLAGLVGTSSGNGGAAAAAYAAAAGSRVVLFALSDTLAMKLLEITAVGGVVFRVDGVGHDAASTRQVADQVARAAQANDYYPMLTGYHFAPEAMMAVETIAYEIAEQAGELTEVYAPVGGGGLLTGLHRGFSKDSAQSGVTAPRMVGVHPEGASALAFALSGDDRGMPGPVTSTVSGLQMAVLYDVEGAVTAVRESNGRARPVTDEEVWEAQRMLARRCGMLVEPAGATALAGVIADVRDGLIGAGSRVAAILTGAGYKDSTALARLGGADEVAVIAASQVGDTLARLLQPAAGGR